MLLEILKQLAAGRPELLGPLAYGLVASDLFAWSLGMLCASSLSKKIIENPDAYPPRHELKGSRRLFFRIEEIDAWSKNSLKPVNFCVKPKPRAAGNVMPAVRRKAGRPSKSEQKEAMRRGITVPELRQIVDQGGA